MRIRLAAPLISICLCTAANAATSQATAPLPVRPQGASPAPEVVLTVAALPDQAPARPQRPSAPTTETDPLQHDERGLLLAGIALMVAIALRRTGGPQ